MHSNRASSTFAYIKKSPDDVITRSSTVDKDEIVVLETGVSEALCLVKLVVEPNNARDAAFTKVFEVGFRRMNGVTYGRTASTSQDLKEL